MRRLHGVASVLISTSVSLAAMAAYASEPYEDKTLQLRSGPVTLQPTVAPPSAPAAGPATTAKPDDGRTTTAPPAAKRNILIPQPGPPTDPQPNPQTGAKSPAPGGIEAKALDKAKRKGSYLARKLASERVILSFERRLSHAERLLLVKRGIIIGDYLGDTAYEARVRQTGTEELVRASQGINTIQHVIAFDQSNAHIKIDPTLAARVGPPKEAAPVETPAAQPSGQPAGQPPPGAARNAPVIESTTRGIHSTPRGAEAQAAGTVVVEIWPDTDLEQVRVELAKIGEIRRVSPRTRKIELSIGDYKAVEAIARLKGVKFVAPSYGIRTQNTRVAHNIGIDIAREPQHALTGDGVRVGVWDGGHVAANHPSFRGRLTVDLPRERTPLGQPVTRRDDEHATHVAGTIAGSGEYVPLATPAVASEGGRRRQLREIDLPAFGPELTVKPRVSRAGTTVPAVPVVAADGPGEAEQRYPGMAVKAQINSFDFEEAAEELIELLATKPDAIDVVNNSWGLSFDQTNCNQLASSTLLNAPDFDALVSGEVAGQPIRRIPVLFAAGNVRNDEICGMSGAAGFPNYRTVVPPGTAKNVITVGAIDADSNAMTDFSGWGPTSNGRLKPDVVAPGCRALKGGERGIISAIPADTIGRNCGTSMATPAVTGVVALMIEKMVKLGQKKTDVFPSTYKALLIHGAEDLGRPGPDFEFGYGRVQLGPTLRLMDERAFLQSRVEREGQVVTLALTVGANAGELKVTLAWDDRPTGVFTTEALSNDLDVVAIGPDGRQHLPLVLNAVPGKEKEDARPAVDRLNVVEQVAVKQPAAGAWRVEVRAAKIGSATGGQTFSLVTSVR